MIPLHKIEKEITSPILSRIQERAIAAFQRYYTGRFLPLILQVENNTVTQVYYTYLANAAQEFTADDMEDWSSTTYRDTDKINWDTIIIRRS